MYLVLGTGYLADRRERNKSRKLIKDSYLMWSCKCMPSAMSPFNATQFQNKQTSLLKNPGNLSCILAGLEQLSQHTDLKMLRVQSVWFLLSPIGLCNDQIYMQRQDCIISFLCISLLHITCGSILHMQLFVCIFR